MVEKWPGSARDGQPGLARLHLEFAADGNDAEDGIAFQTVARVKN